MSNNVTMGNFDNKENVSLANKAVLKYTPESSDTEDFVILAKDIDINRIAISSDLVGDGKFIDPKRLDTSIWSSDIDINYEIRGDNVVLLKNGDVAIGWTDLKGINKVVGIDGDIKTDLNRPGKGYYYEKDNNDSSNERESVVLYNDSGMPYKEFFDESGNLNKRVVYREDEKTLFMEQHFNNDKVTYQISYENDGVTKNNETWFYDNEKVRSTIDYKDGKRDYLGFYREDGTLYWEGTNFSGDDTVSNVIIYKNDGKTKFSEYIVNGSINSYIGYKDDGVKKDFQYDFSESGSLKIKYGNNGILEFDNSNLQSTYYVQYGDDGKSPIFESHIDENGYFVNEMYYGSNTGNKVEPQVEVKYHKDGITKFSEAHIGSDGKSKTTEFFDKNGVIERKVVEHDNKIIAVTEYDKNGNSKMTTFQDGSIIK